MAGLRFASAGRAVYPLLDFQVGAHTVIQLADRSADGAFHTLLSSETSGAVSRWGVGWRNTNAFGCDNGSGGSTPDNAGSGVPFTASEGVFFQGYCKAAASDVPLFFKAAFASGAWGALSFYPGNAALGDGSAVGVGGALVYGQYQAGDQLNGDLYLNAILLTELTQTNIQSIFAALTTASIDAFATGPNDLIHDASDTLATDLTGNGRDRSALSGTSTVAPPGGMWTFGVTTATTYTRTGTSIVGP